jgi:hypothetical protein
MIDFNRDKFPENNEQNLGQKLEENLRMQADCEIEIERCREANDTDSLVKTKETLAILKMEEISLKEQMGN